ncbi:hypothetical protein FFLO_03523 [Filobasidium floriforme]|uniref:Uncharacterized protein n=1 Tax=Filobasidium floriforme TaxID=5210 RepID=A0A8K0NT30_9TREE|nr:uncharacterized protein HD553DRAFT_350228 [Filobasidium floriforme]KAG7536003.1 hypothetical protein FFLO_03523 [Filobasidium floriforme]KAH8084834.1 hypothetical protein HD553DRAFT_350228 [Filobasidium floriforme]
MSSNAKLPQRERPGRWTDAVMTKGCDSYVYKDSDKHLVETFQSRQWWALAWQDAGDVFKSGDAQYREWQYSVSEGKFVARTPQVKGGQPDVEINTYPTQTYRDVCELCARNQNPIPVWVLELMDTSEQRVELAMRNALLRRSYSRVQAEPKELWEGRHGVQKELSTSLGEDMTELDGTEGGTDGDKSSRTQGLFYSLLADSQFGQLTARTSASSADSSKK